MNKHYIQKGSKAHTPKGIRDLFEQAVINEGGDIGKVLSNKHKYKALLELWHASFLALAINKWLGQKYYLCPADNPANPGPPDVFFMDQEKGEAFPVEVTELHTSANDLWMAKGKTNYDKCHLLIISRVKGPIFDVTKFTREIQKYDWKFERIWLGIYTAASVQWIFFDIFPPAQFNATSSITFSTKNKADMTSYY